MTRSDTKLVNAATDNNCFESVSQSYLLLQLYKCAVEKSSSIELFQLSVFRTEKARPERSRIACAEIMDHFRLLI